MEGLDQEAQKTGPLLPKTGHFPPCPYSPSVFLETQALGPSCPLQLVAFLAKSWFRYHIFLRHLHLWVEDSRKEYCMLTHSISMAAFTRARQRNLSPRSVMSKVMERLKYIKRFLEIQDLLVLVVEDILLVLSCNWGELVQAYPKDFVQS